MPTAPPAPRRPTDVEPLFYAAVRPEILFVGACALLVASGFLFLFVGGIVQWMTAGIPDDANMNPVVFLLLALAGGLIPLALGLLFVLGRVSVLIEPGAGQVVRTFRWLRHRCDRVHSFDEFQAVGIGVAAHRGHVYHFARLLGATNMSIPGGGSRAAAEEAAREIAAAMNLPVNDEPQRVAFGPILG